MVEIQFCLISTKTITDNLEERTERINTKQTISKKQQQNENHINLMKFNSQKIHFELYDNYL